MTHRLFLSIAVVALVLLGPPSEGAQALERCLSDADCPGAQVCSKDECLSCCPPSALICIEACCGQCIGNPADPCPLVLCSQGYVPITDVNGCARGCRPVPVGGS